MLVGAAIAAPAVMVATTIASISATMMRFMKRISFPSSRGFPVGTQPRNDGARVIGDACQMGGGKRMPIISFPSLGSIVTHTTMARSGKGHIVGTTYLWK